MLTLNRPFRKAKASDASILAKLVNYAGHGLPEYVWSGIARSEEDPWEVGERRLAEKAENNEITVVDTGSGVIACLNGYIIPQNVEPIPIDMPPLFVPLQELENMAPSTWYINVLATLPEYRGQGHGSLLLKLSEEIAVSHGLSKTSLIVADNNADARKLYARAGYKEIARKPVVKDNWSSNSSEWILMTKEIKHIPATTQ